ncbi:cob(I)yrinic acid a,c-diamide adenosyltransferase [Aminipila butyrica]|uniref:Corrinoid adenosyltransferase n=1 Tax=Aminipila butyrica TaxID=433296 RepID=A0A858BVN8_9FIRM|nr:cob(I)yrinic acid a,c-diamide adenosyltransferase [Aminipila butyrica]QIB69168.1 cob(I)yrinic acid a,c-diamide adenosyltransferase [Aminipila butyrica]
MANLYTKTGDKGQTGLVGGARVPKDSPRVDCYGTIDEANSMLGLAYSYTEHPYIRECIHGIQKKLFVLGAELASDEKGLSILKNTISDEDVAVLEGIVDTCTETTGKQTAFVIPGVNSASAAMHVARTIIRRAERTVISASRQVDIRENLHRYINRLSDAIYALARLEETYVEQAELRAKVEETVRKVVEKAGGQRDDCQNPPFDLETIKRMAQYAEQKAKEMNVPMVFSAVDSGGNLMLLHRMEESLLISIKVSFSKAYTANALKLPTEQLAELIEPGGEFYSLQHLHEGHIIAFGGGIPYKVDGKIVGAIGVSGGSSEEDMAIAQFALKQVSGGQ